MTAYEPGASYESVLTVTDKTGALANAVTVTLTVTKPDGTTATPSVTNDSTGKYHADYTLALEGLYIFSWATVSPNTQQTDYVPVNQFRSLITLDEARTYIGETDTTRDDILRQVLSSLTEKIESIVGTCVKTRYVNEVVSGSTANVIRLARGPLPSDSTVETVISVYPGGPSWVTADLIVYPDSATVETVSMVPFWRGPWKVTYTAGRTVIPSSIQLALKESLFDFWANQRPYGADSLEPGMDDTARWEQAIAGYDLPPHARTLLEQYEQPGFA